MLIGKLLGQLLRRIAFINNNSICHRGTQIHIHEEQWHTLIIIITIIDIIIIFILIDIIIFIDIIIIIIIYIFLFFFLFLLDKAIEIAFGLSCYWLIATKLFIQRIQLRNDIWAGNSPLFPLIQQFPFLPCKAHPLDRPLSAPPDHNNPASFPFPPFVYRRLKCASIHRFFIFDLLSTTIRPLILGFCQLIKLECPVLGGIRR